MMEVGRTVIRTALVALFVLVASNSADPVAVQVNPWRYPRPDKRTVREGLNLLADCHVTPSPDLDVYWTKQNNSLFRENGTELEFLDIGREASGVYVCHAVNTSAVDEPDRIVKLLTVDVQYPAEITRMTLTPDTVRVGQDFFINGTILANPYADYEYVNVRTGHVMVSGRVSGILPVGQPARCEDFGTWAIKASNFLNEGHLVTETRQLTVLCAPEPDPRGGITYQKKSFHRHNATFRMEYVGYPDVTVTWVHNDEVIPSWRQMNDHNSTTLLFDHVTVDDFGQYTLKMRNSIGSHTSQFTLNPEGPPQRPFDLTYYDVTSDGVTLRWASGFDMGSRQQFTVYRITESMFSSVSGPIHDTSSTHGVGQHWSYTVTSLDSDTEYNLTVEAMNADEHETEGFARPWAKFRTRMYPWPYPRRDTQTVREGLKLLADCHVAPSPDLDVYWTKQNNSFFRENGTELEFRDIGREASGVYVCHAVNTSAVDDPGRIVELLTVDVQYPAEITRMTLTPDTVRVGEVFIINGTILANPHADYQYVNVRTGQLMVSGRVSGVLPMGQIAQCEDFGFWAIKASNFLNEGHLVTSHTRQLTVLCAPEPDPRGGITYQKKSFLRHNATFRMEYVGYPDVTVTWVHNDEDIPYWRQMNDHNSTTLLFDHVTVDDFGQYTLTMRNSMGSHTSQYTLNPDGPPQRPFDLTYFDVTSDGVRLHWASGFDMGSAQQFTVYKITEPYFTSVSGPILDTSSTHGVGQHWSYTVTGLDSDTEYNLTVEAMHTDAHYTEGFARPYARFWTRRAPQPEPYPDDGERGTVVVVGATVGGLVFIGLLAFVVYLVKYRHMRTSYGNMDKKIKK